jgi:hypothetical protein
MVEVQTSEVDAIPASDLLNIGLIFVSSVGLDRNAL